jgi:hypothetical protein
MINHGLSGDVSQQLREGVRAGGPMMAQAQEMPRMGRQELEMMREIALRMGRRGQGGMQALMQGLFKR